MQRIPVTIITGFLGSGKTTLLNQIIKQNAGKKIAIIENEFGEISIDSELVIKTEDGLYELSNGCICCSLNGELISILTKIINSNPNLDHLIIETTGVADPGPVAISFISDYKIQHLFRLDGIIALVDSVFIEQHLENTVEANKQIAVADVVLLNKSDKTDSYQLDTVRNIICRINANAQIFTTEFGKVDGINLLEIEGFSAESVLKTQFEKLQENKPTRKFSMSKDVEKSGFSVLNNKFMQHTAMSSHSFILDEPLDVLKFDAWIKMALSGEPFQVFRAKGILQIENFEKKVVFQSVYGQYVTEDGGTWQENEKRTTKMVFIGRNLDYDLLLEGLKMCCINPEIEGIDEDFFSKMLDWQERAYNFVVR
jgi:G3E family GTPase